MSYIAGTSQHVASSSSASASTTASASASPSASASASTTNDSLGSNIPSTSSSNNRIGISICNPDWAEEQFAIPYSKIDFNIQEDLIGGKRLSPSQRISMVRTVIETLHKHRGKPLKKVSAVVAKRMVAKYPRSLRDEIEGDAIGCGYGSLTNQLQSRWENINRLTERQSKPTPNATPKQSKEKKRDTYGCVNFLPSLDKETTDLVTMKTFQEEMKDNDAKNGHDKVIDKSIERQLDQTYYMQRRQLNAGDSIPQLLKDWPFLFTEVGMGLHFKKLTDINLKETVLEAIEKKQPKIISFMESLKTKKPIAELMAEVKTVMMETKSGECQTEGMFLAVMAYFGEDSSMFILRTDVSTYSQFYFFRWYY